MAEVSNTPFARMLTRFMWSKQPPWSAAKVAAVLGVHRTRVANWVYHDNIPELDTMMVVMARLGIPMSALLDAYVEAGIPVPPLTAAPEAQPQPAPSPRQPITQSEAGFYAVPDSRRGRAKGANQPVQPDQPAQGATTQGETMQAQQPTQQQDEWAVMLEHTRRVMGMTGMAPAAVDAMLAHIQRVQAGEETDSDQQLRRRLAEEHGPQQQQQNRHQSRQQSTRHGRQQSGHLQPDVEDDPVGQ